MDNLSLMASAREARQNHSDTWCDFAARIASLPPEPYPTFAALALAEFALSPRQWHRAVHAGRCRAALSQLTSVPLLNVGAGVWEHVAVTDAPVVAARINAGMALREALTTTQAPGLYSPDASAMPVNDDLPPAFHALSLAVTTLAFATPPEVLAEGTAVIFEAANALYTILSAIQPPEGAEQE